MKELRASDSVHVSDAAAITTRTYISIRHLQAAAVLAEATRRAEDEWPAIGPTFDEQGLVRIVANAIGSLYCSVAFLEASISELYLDSLEREEFLQKHHWAKLTARHPDLLMKLAETWPKVERRTRLVDKYRRAKEAAGLPATMAAEGDVAAMVELRNWTTHAKPETNVVSSSIEDLPVTKRPRLEAVLVRFERNRKWGDAALSTDAILSAGCARWAVRSSLAFADDFWNALGIQAPYDHVRPS